MVFWQPGASSAPILTAEKSVQTTDWKHPEVALTPLKGHALRVILACRRYFENNKPTTDGRNRCCRTCAKARPSLPTAPTTPMPCKTWPSKNGLGQHSGNRNRKGQLSLQRIGLSPTQSDRTLLQQTQTVPRHRNQIRTKTRATFPPPSSWLQHASGSGRKCLCPRLRRAGP